MNTTGETPKLEYFISEKQSFLVISLLGTVTKATIPAIDRCRDEALKSKASNVVISLHDVNTVEISGVPALIRLQKAMRDKPAELRLAFLKPSTAKSLLEAGAVRPDELADNLLAALQSFQKRA
jgi:anti-anti-sigma regulatory factor